MSQGLDESSSPEQTVPSLITSSASSSSTCLSSPSSMDTNHSSLPHTAAASYFSFRQTSLTSPSSASSPPCFGFRPVMRTCMETSRQTDTQTLGMAPAPAESDMSQARPMPDTATNNDALSPFSSSKATQL